MVPFAGWEMPLMYTSIKDEHFAVRKTAGLFDVSHMGEIIIKGKKAEDFLSWVLPSNIRQVKVGTAFYSHILNHQGLIIDDTIAMRLKQKEFLLVPNAANTDKILAWFGEQNSFGVKIIDKTHEMSCLALQGPLAEKILAKLAFIDRDLKEISFFTYGKFTFKDEELIISRTGYTGEDGFELYVPNTITPDIWDMLLEAGKDMGILPCGLACRDTLRLEKGFLLSGQDFHMDRTILETGWEVLIQWDKDFIGKDVLKQQKETANYHLFKPFLVKDKGIPRTNCPIEIDGKQVGIVTSGTMSPMLGKGIALGYIAPEHAETGTEVDIRIRNKLVKAELVSLPFI